MNMLMAQPGAAFTNGFNQAGQIREQKKQNSLAELFRTQGSDIAAGNPAAMNALAQLDPMAARGISRENAADARAQQSFEMQKQSHGQSMQIGKMQIDKIRQDSKLQAEQHAANMTAQERAAEAAQIASVTSAAAAAYRQGPEAFSAYIQGMAPQIQQAGIDPAQITYESFPAYAAGLVGLREGLEAGIAAGEGFVPDAPKPLSGAGKLATDLEAGIITPEQYNSANQKSGMRVTSDGKGGFTFEQGVGVTGDPGDKSDPSSPAAMLNSIDGILNDPALEKSTGIFSYLQALPGTDQYRFGARAKQLQGQAFLQAFESLKGAGQITEIEGTKATEAIGRLDTAQSAEDYREALGELREILVDAQARSSAKPASGDNPFTGMTPEALSKVDIQSLTGEQIDQLFEATMK